MPVVKKKKPVRKSTKKKKPVIKKLQPEMFDADSIDVPIEFSATKEALPGEMVVLDHPDEAGTKIIVEAKSVINQHGLIEPLDKRVIVKDPVIMRTLSFDEWPEEVQREEYELFMQKVRTYREYWPGNIEWPTFEDFLDADVRNAAQHELNEYIAGATSVRGDLLVPLTELWLNNKDEISHKKEEVNHPDHYGGADNPYEVIKIIEHYQLDFKEGNVLKYLLRHKKKNGLVDLKKSKWYLDRKVAQEEEKETLNISSRQTK